MSGQTPSSPAEAGATRAPSALECKFLAAILKNSDGVTNIDWDTVASEAGYNSAATAKVRFGQVKKALGWTVRTAGARSSPTKSPNKVEKKPAKPRVRKTKAMMKKEEDAYQMALTQAADDDSNGDEQDDDNGAKKEGVNGYKHEDEAVKVEDVDEDGDDTLVEEEYASADDYA
ncbi:hypothetical protein V490_07843 [Pseudogymnoascus sp. VKM F-3557]|nr:hypothetical protein V490_07843 [Pseudogymnoascus sp. VKM F-3557]